MKQMLTSVKGILPFNSQSKSFIVGLPEADNSAMNVVCKAVML